MSLNFDSAAAELACHSPHNLSAVIVSTGIGFDGVHLEFLPSMCRLQESFLGNDLAQPPTYHHPLCMTPTLRSTPRMASPTGTPRHTKVSVVGVGFMWVLICLVRSICLLLVCWHPMHLSSVSCWKSSTFQRPSTCLFRGRVEPVRWRGVDLGWPEGVVIGEGGTCRVMRLDVF